MKFIIPLFSFIFIFISCKSDDDNSNTNELNITEENTLFEGHWYAIHLSNELDEVQIEIDSLQVIIDSNGIQTPQSTLDAFDNATDRKMELDIEHTAQNTINTNLLTANSIAGKVFPPIPPCLCAPVGTDKFIASGTLNKLTVTFLDANETLIGSFNSLSQVPDYEGNLQFVAVNLSDYTGLMTMQVEREDSNGETTTYQIDNIAVTANNVAGQ